MLDLHGMSAPVAWVWFCLWCAARCSQCTPQCAVVTYLHSIKKQFHDRCLAGEVPEVIFESFPQQISIITGWGRNSESGVSVIKPLIENLLVSELVPPIRIIQQPFNNTGVILIPRSQLRRWLNMSVISNAKAVWRTHIPRSVPRVSAPRPPHVHAGSMSRGCSAWTR